MLGEREFDIGDSVECNIFYTGISRSVYVDRLKKIAEGKKFTVDKTANNHVQVPGFRGTIVKKKDVTKGSVIFTVKSGKDEVTLLNDCWNLIAKKRES